MLVCSAKTKLPETSSASFGGVLHVAHGIVTEDADEAWVLQGESVVLVLDQDVALDRALENGWLRSRVSGINELVRSSHVCCDTRARFKVAKPPGSSNDTGGHVINPGSTDRPIVDHLNQVAVLPQRRVRHDHIQTGIRTTNTTLMLKPITHHKPFKRHLRLQEPVQHLAVLARVGVVDALVRAHDARGAGLDGIVERPEVELVHGLVVDVGGQGLVVCEGGELFDLAGRFAGGFLFVGDEVLETGHNGLLEAKRGFVG